MTVRGTFDPYVIQATAQASLTEGNVDQRARREHLQGCVHSVLADFNIVYGVPAMPLDVHDIPLLAI